MPTDTQRAPLSAAIEKERSAALTYYTGDGPREPYNTARAATDEAVRAVEEEITRLRQYIEMVIRAECWDQESLDGGDLQDRAVEAGILAPVTAAARCGENCACSEYGADFPATCYRFAWRQAATTGGASDE